MNLSRRSFIESGALVVAFNFFPSIVKAQASLPGSLRNNRMLNAWLRVDPNGTVTIFSGKIELGQGIGTALSQIAADELDVELKRVVVIHGDTALTPTKARPRAANRCRTAAPRCASPAPRRARCCSAPRLQNWGHRLRT